VAETARRTAPPPRCRNRPRRAGDDQREHVGVAVAQRNPPPSDERRAHQKNTGVVSANCSQPFRRDRTRAPMSAPTSRPSPAPSRQAQRQRDPEPRQEILVRRQAHVHRLCGSGSAVAGSRDEEVECMTAMDSRSANRHRPAAKATPIVMASRRKPTRKSGRPELARFVDRLTRWSALSQRARKRFALAEWATR